MSSPELDLIQQAAIAYLHFVPSLSQEINQSIPSGSSLAVRRSRRREKGWAELCLSAHRIGLEPSVFARQVIQLRNLERRRAR